MRESGIKTRKILIAALGVAALASTGARVGTAIAAQNPTTTQQTPKQVAKADKEAKQLLLLMDTDKDGKVSKAEFMRFMEAEFDRLDKNKDGELDVQELSGLQVRPRSVGVSR